MADTGEDLFSLLELTEYEAEALEELLLLGRTTAPDLGAACAVGNRLNVVRLG
jgi:sugar-specific transcriptional regulator TrmB